ncbi:MAG: Cadmium-transporting ATPase [Desulfovibrio sp.]
MNVATKECSCTSHHVQETPTNHEHTHENACCGHEHETACCDHDHAVPEPLDPAIADTASATRAVYRILNMDCPMEETLIRKKLESMEGVTGLQFNLMQRVLTVDHALQSTAAIEAALRSIGMEPETMGATRGAAPESKIPWRTLAAAGVFAALSEAFELVHEWNAAPFGLDMHAWNIGGVAVLEYLPLFLAVIAILLGGIETYKKGWIAVKTGNLNINALMSVAVTGAVIIGQYPEAAMVMVLFAVAEAIEAKALDKARDAIKDLLALAPETATVLQPNAGSGDAPGNAPGDALGAENWLETDIREVPVGARVRVKPGERVALDGVIASGHSAINQAPITGESMPVEKTVGDTVYAGTINESGSFEFTVTAKATESTLARIIHAVEEAQGSRAPIQRFVDQFARYYTPAVFCLAILIALVPPLFLGGVWKESVYTALVVLVIGCPCALVISTPVSIVSGMAAATRSGILVKGGMFLEQGRLLKWLALDKTGTITHGKPRLTDFTPLEITGESQTMRLAASLAARSDHPVSKAIAEAFAQNADAKNVPFLPVEDFTAIPGQGVRGVMKGETWYLGNHRMIEELGKCSPELEERIAALETQGKSVVALIGTAGVLGIFAVADTLKETSVEAIRTLQQLGIKTMMLTGDNEHTARAIAERVGVDAYKGNLLPEDKLAAVEALRNEGASAKKSVVGMVGDGINDAPALAGADIGFAMAAAGTDTAIETADVALMDDDLRKIPRFVRLSKFTYAILMQNITLALGVKAVFFGLTMLGHATMWMAVFADVGTSLLVVANGLRAMRK